MAFQSSPVVVCASTPTPRMPDPERETINVWLSRKAAATWPGAIVVQVDDVGLILRRRERPEVVLGTTVADAKVALALLRKHEA